MTDREFFTFCQLNREIQIERNAKGAIMIMLPVGGEGGNRNATISALLWHWARADKSGVSFDSSTGFKLPNGATYSPDAAWVKRSRLTALTPEEKERFLPLCPDFVVELRSKIDHLKPLQEKMQEYIENGAQLGWLIDPRKQDVYVYRPEKPVEHLEKCVAISGDPVLPGFMLDLKEVWEPQF